MKRQVDLTEISDGRRYRAKDLVKADLRADGELDCIKVWKPARQQAGFWNCHLAGFFYFTTVLVCSDRHIYIASLFHRLLLHNGSAPKSGSGGPSGHIGSATFRTDACVVGDGLGNDFLILFLRLSSGMGHMLRLVGADGKGGPLRTEPGGCLEGDSRVSGAVLVLRFLQVSHS